jgi:hypothetical protein
MEWSRGDNLDANGGLAEATASRLRFDSAEDAVEGEEVGMEVEETPKAEGEEAAVEVIGSDQTSADYYFDSYSHFGTGRSISQRRYFYFSPPAELCALKKIESYMSYGAGENARLSVLL